MTSRAVISHALHTPSLNEIAEIFEKRLKENYSEVICEVVQCPDLSQSPWELAAPGICGSTRIGELGGVKYLLPLPQLNKIYDIKDLAQDVNLPDGLFIGAGAGPFPYVGVNSELISNIRIGKYYNNESRTVKLNDSKNEYILKKLPSSESRVGILFNFFACEGVGGPVLKINVKKRTGDDDFVGCMRKALEKEYGTKPVGMGGTFIMKNGTAKIHVMPDFSKTPLQTENELEDWLRFFSMKGPLTFMSVFLSYDPGLEFRLEHTHGYGENAGGHYHTDITPDEVEYDGYFNIANFIYRVDKP